MKYDNIKRVIGLAATLFCLPSFAQVISRTELRSTIGTSNATMLAKIGTGGFTNQGVGVVGGLYFDNGQYGFGSYDQSDDALVLSNLFHGTSIRLLSSALFDVPIVAPSMSLGTLYTGDIILTNAIGVASGGTGKTNATANKLLSGNDTNALDEVTVGTTLSLAGTAGSTRTLDVSSAISAAQRRVTNYAHATSLGLDASTDVAAYVTNTTSANVALLITNTVPGTSGTFTTTSDGSARTFSIFSDKLIVMISTNETVNSTQIVTTASKKLKICWQVDLASATATNIAVWAKSQP